MYPSPRVPFDPNSAGSPSSPTPNPAAITNVSDSRTQQLPLLSSSSASLHALIFADATPGEGWRPLANRTEAGVVGPGGDDGSGTGAEALLWGALDAVMFYAPWSVAVLLGLQLWLIGLWAM